MEGERSGFGGYVVVGALWSEDEPGGANGREKWRGKGWTVRACVSRRGCRGDI